jgi:LytS/YehU family sensor histidine kinase
MVLRNNIDNANKDMISLTEELTYLKLYLKLEQMRFEEKFSFLISVDENINPHNIKMPPMLIQPFLEHAIKYGIGKLNKAGKLVIRFILEEDGYLKCEITDNGLGNRKIDIEKSEFVKDNSLQITCDRMKLLNKVLTNGRTYSYQINEFIDSKTQFSGVKTELGFPKL